MASLKDAEVLDVGTNSVQRGVVEDGRFHVHTTYYDDPVLELNKHLRDNDYLGKAKFSLHDNADVLGHFQVPSAEQWSVYQRNNPDVVALLFSKEHEHERRAGLKRVHDDHPEWFTQRRG